MQSVQKQLNKTAARVSEAVNFWKDSPDSAHLQKWLAEQFDMELYVSPRDVARKGKLRVPRRLLSLEQVEDDYAKTGIFAWRHISSSDPRFSEVEGETDAESDLGEDQWWLNPPEEISMQSVPKDGGRKLRKHADMRGSKRARDESQPERDDRTTVRKKAKPNVSLLSTVMKTQMAKSCDGCKRAEVPCIKVVKTSTSNRPSRTFACEKCHNDKIACRIDGHRAKRNSNLVAQLPSVGDPYEPTASSSSVSPMKIGPPIGVKPDGPRSAPISRVTRRTVEGPKASNPSSFVAATSMSGPRAKQPSSDYPMSTRTAASAARNALISSHTALVAESEANLAATVTELKNSVAELRKIVLEGSSRRRG